MLCRILDRTNISNNRSKHYYDLLLMNGLLLALIEQPCTALTHRQESRVVATMGVISVEVLALAQSAVRQTPDATFSSWYDSKGRKTEDKSFAQAWAEVNPSARVYYFRCFTFRRRAFLLPPQGYAEIRQLRMGMSPMLALHPLFSHRPNACSRLARSRTACGVSGGCRRGAEWCCAMHQVYTSSLSSLAAYERV